MKPRLLFLAGLLCLPLASAGAEDPTPDAYETNFANIVGIIGAGGADWYVSYPTNVPVTGTYHVAVTASTTAAATASITLTSGSFQGSGCTVGSFTSDTAATSQASGYLPVTVTGPYCFGSARFAIVSSSTTITAIRASFQIAADTVDIMGFEELAADLCDNPAGHGHCELHLHGGVDVDITDDETDDGLLSVTVPDAADFNSTFGNVTFQAASAKEKATAGFSTWAPLLLALAVLAVSVMGGTNINYIGVGFSGVMFMYAGVAAWKGSGVWPLGILLIGFGAYLTFIAGTELRDWREKALDSEADSEESPA